MRIFSLFIFVALLSCNSKKENLAATNTVPQEKKESSSARELPSISHDLIDKLYAEVDFVDYIWHDVPISLTIDTKEDAYTNVGFISQSTVGKIPVNCKNSARKFLNSKGNTLATLDVYYGEGCNFYIQIESNKAVAANYMTEKGVNFYANIMKQSLGK
jgi:hypothetical protein